MSILHTEQEKLACVDQQIEMAVVCDVFQVYRNAERWNDTPTWSIMAKLSLRKNGDTYEINTRHADLVDAVAEAYTRYRRLLGALPEFNANRTIEHKPEADEIPF